MGVEDFMVLGSEVRTVPQEEESSKTSENVNKVKMTDNLPSHYLLKA